MTAVADFCSDRWGQNQRRKNGQVNLCQFYADIVNGRVQHTAATATAAVMTMVDY